MIHDTQLDYNDSNIKEIINERYQYYNESIRIKDNLINGNRMKIKHYPEIDGYCGTFFHIITKDSMNKEISCCPNRILKCQKNFKYNPLMDGEFAQGQKRTICPHKISTMYLLENFFTNSSVLLWERLETTPNGKRTRIKLLDLEQKYLVILEKRKNGDIFYWTSYPVDYNYKIDKFKKEYYKYKKDTQSYTFEKL